MKYSTKQAIQISKENLNDLNSIEIKDMILETAKLYPPTEDWIKEFKNDTYIYTQLKLLQQ